jgi:hypothetical protein
MIFDIFDISDKRMEPRKRSLYMITEISYDTVRGRRRIESYVGVFLAIRSSQVHVMILCPLSNLGILEIYM